MRHSRLYIIMIMLLSALSINAQRQKPVQVKILTFNIRYENKEDGRNNWEMRFLNVGSFLKKSKADIIGLQEVTHHQLEDLANQLPNYAHVGVARDDGKQAGEYNPVFYNKDRFNLITSGTFWLSPNTVEPTQGWDAVCKRIATWAILQDKTTMKSIIFLNTHLDHIGKQARLESANLIKNYLSRMNNGLPVAVSGDFNVDETDPVYTKFSTGIFPLFDTYKATTRIKGPTYTWHNFGKLPEDQRSKIDYILVNKQVQVKSAQIYDTSLGDGFYLSDHNAYSADLVF